MVLGIVGGLFSGLGLMWGVYTWVWDRRDKLHAEEVKKMYETFWSSEERIENTINALSSQLQGISREIQALILEIRQEEQKTGYLIEVFTEYVGRVNSVIEKHEKKLEELGRIIHVGINGKGS